VAAAAEEEAAAVVVAVAGRVFWGFEAADTLRRTVADGVFGAAAVGEDRTDRRRARGASCSSSSSSLTTAARFAEVVAAVAVALAPLPPLLVPFRFDVVPLRVDLRTRSAGVAAVVAVAGGTTTDDRRPFFVVRRFMHGTSGGADDPARERRKENTGAARDHATRTRSYHGGPAPYALLRTAAYDRSRHTRRARTQTSCVHVSVTRDRKGRAPLRRRGFFSTC
jgi:hypothetical protein